MLFRSLLKMGLVDAVQVGVMPILLGDGIPLLPPPFQALKLKLTNQKIFKSGIVLLDYDIERPTAVGPERKRKLATAKKRR